MAKKPKKTPKKRLEKFFLLYGSLVKDYPAWGREYESIKKVEEEKKNPTHDNLTFAFLTRIVVLLREIRDEIKKERTMR